MSSTSFPQPEVAHHTERIRSLLADVAGAHFRMVLVAGSTSARRSQVLGAVSELLGCPYFSVGQRLSTALMEVSANLRAVAAEDVFNDLIRGEGRDTLCLGRLDILFDAPLMLNGIALVKNVSRRFRLVASWPGLARGENLCLGAPEHPSHTVIPFQEAECPIYQIP